MIHPVDKIKLPIAIENVLEYIDENTADYLDYYERGRAPDYLFYELASAILKCKFDFDSSNVDLTPELGYFSMPFEIVPFSYNGGDALNYSWVNFTPELGNTDYYCVSYAPLDDWAVLLGNSPAEGLYNLMIGNLRGWEKWGKKEKIPPNETKHWKELVKLIGPFKDSKINITVGARSDRMIDPMVKNGWRYHPCVDGIGILALEKYFSTDFKQLPLRAGFDIYAEKAEDYLKAGKAASAIIILKQAKDEMILYKKEEIVTIVNQFKKAYEILNRESHFNRAEIWLNRNIK